MPRLSDAAHYLARARRSSGLLAACLPGVNCCAAPERHRLRGPSMWPCPPERPSIRVGLLRVVGAMQPREGRFRNVPVIRLPAGGPTGQSPMESCRARRSGDAPFHKRRARFLGLEMSGAQQRRAYAEENGRPKRRRSRCHARPRQRGLWLHAMLAWFAAIGIVEPQIARNNPTGNAVVRRLHRRHRHGCARPHPLKQQQEAWQSIAAHRTAPNAVRQRVPGVPMQGLVRVVRLLHA